MEIYAIVQASTGHVLWTGTVDGEYADQMTVRYAVTYGNVTLLSGDDLPAHPVQCGCMAENPGDGEGERVLTHSATCFLHPDYPSAEIQNT